MSILEDEDPIPETIPEGFSYFIYSVKSDEKEAFGCFIGNSPDDVFESSVFKGFIGDKDPARVKAVVSVIRVNRDEFIDFCNTIKAANVLYKMKTENITRDSPAA